MSEQVYLGKYARRSLRIMRRKFPKAKESSEASHAARLFMYIKGERERKSCVMRNLLKR
jgi:hypothetical protein